MIIFFKKIYPSEITDPSNTAQYMNSLYEMQKRMLLIRAGLVFWTQWPCSVGLRAPLPLQKWYSRKEP